MKETYGTYGLEWARYGGGNVKPLLGCGGMQVTVLARNESEARAKGARRYRGVNVLIGATRMDASTEQEA